MKRTIFILFCLFMSLVGFSQDSKTVEVKGVGSNRDEALNNAIRTAAEQVGIEVTSESQMENGALIRDAISTKAQGIVQSYDVLEETPLGKHYEIKIRAIVSKSAIKQDAATLSQMLGQLKFIVIYDPRQMKSEMNQTELEATDFAYERVNEQLAKKGYKYQEAKIFKDLDDLLPGIQNDELAFVNKLGFYYQCEFVIQIKKMRIQVEKKAGNMWVANASIEIKAWDACNQEGLGTTVITNDEPGVNPNQQVAIETAIKSAINDKFGKLLYYFNRYMADWLKNGATYQIRFYQEMEYMEHKALRDKLKADASFGGEMQIMSAGGYMKLECSFKAKQLEFIDKLMENIEGADRLKKYQFEPQIIFGRQISLITRGKSIPLLREKEDFLKKASK